jgi:L-lactate dehydrogenase complex protein LldG
MDTSRARANILARIRRAGGTAPAPAAAPADPAALRPRVGEDVVAHFEAQARRMASTTDRVATLAQVPQALAAWLRANGLPAEGVCWRTLAGLDWAAAGLSLEPRAPRDADRLGVTGVFAAIAETGTLMLLSGPDTPASTHLLPETHVAVVPASRVLRHYEDAFARVREERGAPPRAMNLVSGPSRTGDIEQTIVLGAHGPYRVHVLIVEGE